MFRTVLVRALLGATLVVTIAGISTAQGEVPTPEGTAWALTLPSPASSAAPETPTSGAAVERPTLHVPLPPPKGRRPVLSTGRAPDATISRRGVRLELWVPRKAIRTGRWVPATLRVTNLSGRSIKHDGQAGCDGGSDRLRFDFAGLFDAGTEWSGKAARFKKLFLADSGLVSRTMWTVRPVRRNCVGSVGTEETLAAGRSFTVSDVARAVYPWAVQPLPGGKAEVSACYRFEFGRAGDEGPATGRPYDACVSAPVRIKGPDVGYPSPQALADAMLADPVFRTWVEDRKTHAMFHTDVDGPWRKPEHSSWAKHGYVGGPAPMETVHISSQAGGRNGDRVSDLVLDPWTAEVLGTSIVAGRLTQPEGAYPTPSPSPSGL